MSRCMFDSSVFVPSTSKVGDAKCHRIRSSSRGVAWCLLSTMCVVERGMCHAKGCGIFICGS